MAALIGLLTLVEHLTGWNLGIDQLLFSDPLPAVQTSHPGRMAPNTASALLFGNAGLLFLSSATDRNPRLSVAGALAILTMLLGLFGVAGYVGGISTIYSGADFTRTSLGAALACILFGAACLRLAWTKAGWRWSVGVPIIALSALGMLVLVGLSLESFRSTRQSVDMSGLVQHTQQVQTTISDLNAGLAIALSGERGFVITGREDFLTAFTLGNQQAQESERHLRELTADNPRQQARLDQLSLLLQQKLDFTRTIVETRRVDGMERAASLVDTGRGQALLNAIYALTRQMDSEETRLMVQRQAQSTASNSRTFVVLPTGTLVALCLFVGVLLHLNAEVAERLRVEAAVSASEARFRSLVMATSQIIWVTDADGQISGPMPSWQAYTGQGDEEVQGAGWASALHPDDIARALTVWASAVESQSLYEVEYRVRRHDGIYRNFSVRGVAVLNSDQSVREWVGSCTDVTDIRRAEAERDRFFSLSLDLMCIASLDGHFRRINPAFENVLGFSREELFSRPFLDFVHPDDREPTLAALALLSTGNPLVNFENRYRCKDGSNRWFLWSSVAVPEEGIMYATARDISDRKQAEVDIRQLNAELDQRVIERTAQLEAANRELEAFTYSVSHDLRAPLRGVDSFSRMVIEDYGPQLDDEGRRMLNVVRSETQRMGQLIDDLLAFSRVSRLQMRLQSIDMNALVQGVIDKLELPVERQRQISVGPLPRAYGDHNLIQQVWVNLLSNALKFTSRQPTPVIEIGALIADELGTYHVRDNGAGFDPRYVHKLFGVFQRLHSEDEFEGTGVGLALVQRIVQRHGGRVWAEGEVNNGATFYFSLPVPEEYKP